MIILKDTVFVEILEFFDACEFNGRNIPVIVDPLAPNAASSPTGNRGFFDENEIATTVASEARLIKSLYLKLYD